MNSYAKIISFNKEKKEYKLKMLAKDNTSEAASIGEEKIVAAEDVSVIIRLNILQTSYLENE